MKAPFSSRISIAVVLALLLLAINAGLSYFALGRLVAANNLVVDSEHAIKLFGDLRTCIVDAEHFARDYLVTRDARLLEQFQSAKAKIAKGLMDAAALARDDEHRELLKSLGPLIDRRMELFDGVIDAPARPPPSALTALLRTEQNQSISERIRTGIERLQTRLQVRLSTRQEQAERNAYASIVTNAIATLLSVCLLAGILYLVRRDAAARLTSAAAEREFNDKLTQSLAEVRKRNEEITSLSRMSSFLQTCSNTQEACVAIARFGPTLFPAHAGAVFSFQASRNYLDLASSWGETDVSSTSEKRFAPVDCWALRRGVVHAVDGIGSSMVCAHVEHSHHPPASYICAPLTAQGETLGLLFLHPDSSREHPVTSGESILRLASAVAEQIALALSNLTLRETLRQQSIRDPLTGLHNRRYLEETLDRELSRIERRKQPLSLIMIDVDNFKSFNDTFGHEAGDAVLRDLGGLLQRYVRDSDIACRYGGEEFTVIMPEADLEIARQRAEILRDAVRELNLTHNGRSLGAITLSLGVACFPEHGYRRELLVQAADAALYEAKNGGRNRVVVSSAKTLKVVPNPTARDQGGH